MIITLTTDFGNTDEYTGVMKGVILSINPLALIVDICHNIEAQDITQAAYMIKSSFNYFPAGTVHIIVVDPGVGTDRSIIAVKIQEHIFIAPDNGILTLLFDSAAVDLAVSINNSDFFLKSVSSTFHGRDIFAPAGAHISKGIDIRQLGSVTYPEKLIRLPIKKPYIIGNKLFGSVINADRFGNLITNIDHKLTELFCRQDTEKQPVININKHVISGLSVNYNDAPKGQILCLTGSRGFLEIAVNCGSAVKYCNAQPNDSLYLEI